LPVESTTTVKKRRKERILMRRTRLRCPCRPGGSRMDEEVSLLFLYSEWLTAGRYFSYTIVKKLGSAKWMLTNYG
jgi:hypothetical protein